MSNEPGVTARGDEMKRALLAIRDLRRRVDELESGVREPVAIIGMSCRFPGAATTPASFWQLLRDGVDATDEIPRERWDVDAFYDADPEAPGRSYVRRGGFLRERVDGFDPAFFGISPREADAMDPMHRMLLELSWEALEHAAIPAELLEGSDTGVFIGMSGSDYDVLQRDNLSDINSYRGTGAISSVAAGRVSHFLGLHGPNVAMDTACSSALVALALGVDAIRTGRCSMAFAGTAHLILSPEGTIMLSKLRALSAEGRCRTFDAAASGYARAEGGGMFVLKKLSAALADGDPVLAVIRGAAINHDGRSSGLTVPNPRAQRAVIEAALRDGGLAAADVSYVEAHGTATPLGDPIELRALAQALGSRPAASPLMVGSVKTNIGHLEPAAGAAALAKVVLSLQHRQIPAHLHLTEPTPHVPWTELNLTVPTTLTPWNAEPRLAGISGFGFSGTNAHLIVGEAPELPIDDRPRRPCELIVLSGRSRAAVRELAGRYRDTLAAEGDGIVADLAVTSTTGRTALPFRAFATGCSAAELEESLDAIATDGDALVSHFKGVDAGPIAMMFTGQGAQYPGMARALWETAPVFRAELERCDEILRPHLDRSILPLVLEADQGETLRQTMYTQPALFAVEYALAALWRSWGVVPSFVLGHSLGEYVAATVAGVMDLEHALPLIALRGRLMQRLPAGGRMAAVMASEAQVAATISGMDDISIAAINAPASTVVSGSAAAVQSVIDRFTQAGVQCRELEVSHAFHSPLMEPMLADFERAVREIPLRAPDIPLISNLTGTLLDARDATDPARWRRHIREPVRFSASMQRLAEFGVRAFLEVGPHPTLCGLGEQSVSGPVAWLPSLRRNMPAWKQLTQSAGDLFRAGHSLDWKAWSRDYAGRRSGAAPLYAFQRERYWFSDAASPDTSARSDRNRIAAGPLAAHPLLGVALQSPAIDGWAFQSALAPRQPGYLIDHQVRDTVIVPGAVFIEMMTAAVIEGPRWDEAILSGVVFEAPLLLPADAAVSCQVLVSSPAEGAVNVRVVSTATSGGGTRWVTHARAVARPAAAGTARTVNLAELREASHRPLEIDELYRRLTARGISYGPAFRGLESVATGAAGALGRAHLPATVSPTATTRVHPCMLDLSFQLIESLTGADANSADVFLPAGVDEIRIHRSAGDECWIHAVLRENAGDQLVADLTLIADDGETIMELRGFRARRVRQSLLAAAGDSDPLYDMKWESVPAPDVADVDLSGSWLLLEDHGGVGAGIAHALEALGGRCVRVRRAGVLPTPDDALAIDPASAGDWARVAAAVEPHGPLRGVVHLWAIDEAPAEDAAAADWLTHVLDLTAAVPQLLRMSALSGATFGLRILTRGAMGPGHESAHGAEAGAALWGLLRVVQSEYPELSCRAVDIYTRTATQQQLLALLFGDSTEDRLSVRDGSVHAPRLVRAADASEPRVSVPSGESYSIALDRRGTLDALHYVPAFRRAPGPHEVEVRVRATGLNFRDVLNVLGMYPGASGLPGVEFAGVVTRTGSEVNHLSPGDQVIGIGEGTFAAYVTGPAAAVSRKPSSLSPVAAVTIPLAYLTAEWGLADLAALAPGERVLIHAAAGGVGQAAVHLALARGAEVFATAGSDDKRDHLRAQGVQHVFDSRSPSFAQGVLDATAGEGVDVVLNSLTGDLLMRSLELLRPGGRFIEIGKAEILDPADVAVRYPGVRYHAFDLGRILLDEPDTFQALFERVTARFDAHELPPLAARVYDAEHVVDAFRFMAQARHIGKVVVTAGWTTSADGGVRNEASYLVTGAAGGIGRAVVEWLAVKGAGAVFLNGRSAPTDELTSWLTELHDRTGTQLHWVPGDMSVSVDAGRVIDVIEGSALPLAGVFHAAGALDDGLLLDQTRERFEHVMRSKVAGAWNLHTMTRHSDLDHFVLFSSIAAVIGGPGQGSYAAANAFLDSLAASRAQNGLAALSIDWGAWSEAGMASRMSERERRMLEERGLGFLDTDRAMAMLDTLMNSNRHHAVVADIDWKRVAAANRSAPPVLTSLLARSRTAGASERTDAAKGSIDAAMLAALEPADRRERLSSYVRVTLAGVLGIRGATLEEDSEIGQLGFDSLMAMELRNRVETDLGIVVPVAQLLGSATPGALTDEIADMLSGGEPVAAGGVKSNWSEGEI